MADISNLFGSTGLVATTPAGGGHGPGLPDMGGIDLTTILRMKAAADEANDEREIAREGRARQHIRGSVMTGREPTYNPDVVRMHDRVTQQQNTRLGLEARRLQRQQDLEFDARALGGPASNVQMMGGAAGGMGSIVKPPPTGVPGESVHDQIARMVKAGITPEDATLAVSGVNPMAGGRGSKPVAGGSKSSGPAGGGGAAGGGAAGGGGGGGK